MNSLEVIMRKKTYFVKLFIAFMFIALLYTVLVVGIYYLKNLDLIKLENNSQNKNFIEDMGINLDITLTLTDSMIEQMLINPYIDKYNSRDGTGYYDIIKVKDVLENISFIFYKSSHMIALTKLSNSPISL